MFFFFFPFSLFFSFFFRFSFLPSFFLVKNIFLGVPRLILLSTLSFGIACVCMRVSVLSEDFSFRGVYWLMLVVLADLTDLTDVGGCWRM